MATQYRMRAYKTTEPDLGYVSWTADNEPDTDGSESGYDPNDLINIVINNIIQTSDGGTTSYRQSYSPPWTVGASSEISNVLINEQTPSQVYPDLEYLYVWDIVFDAGWDDAREIRITGTDRGGNEISETFLPIPGGGGGRVHGEKVFMGAITFIIPSPGGDGSHHASMQYRNVICTENAPIEEFHYLSLNFTPTNINSFNLSEGWVEPDGHVMAIGDNYVVFYTS